MVVSKLLRNASGSWRVPWVRIVNLLEVLKKKTLLEQGGSCSVQVIQTIVLKDYQGGGWKMMNPQKRRYSQ